MGKLQDDLRGPGVEMEETHCSWVFLYGDHVYKVKKPVDLGFLDYSTADKRREACEAEVRLNRRLAPEVYLGVEPVVRDEGGRHVIGGAGETVDWAVQMRRLDEDRRADALLAADRLTAEHLEAVAETVATFHHRARCDEETSRFGGVEAIAFNVRENFLQTRDTVSEHVTAAQAREIEAWQEGFLREKAHLFAARAEASRVRDGHGDLRLEHIYMGEDGGATIIDCIEFNRRFRFADVAADVAFLSMDLAWHGRVDLAERFLAAYAREAQDYDLYPLVDFYEGYRAYVRAKVASFLSADEGAPAAVRQRAHDEARRYYLLALASERRPLLAPEVVAVGGIIAAGKSTVARRLAAALSAPVVDADRTRKHLLGVEATAPVHVPAFTGPYAPEAGRRVYTEVLRRAEAVLESGRPVVLDASFRTREHRAAARALAQARGVPFHFIECRADPNLCRRRLAQRHGGPHVSDGRLEIFDDFLRRWENVDELPPTEHLILDTARPLAENEETLRRYLPTWPAGLTE